MNARAFFDTNTLLYLISDDAEKAIRAEALVETGGVISVQVLNEFVNVALRKHALSWPEISEALEPIKALCDVVPVSLEIHERAARLAQRFNYRFYDCSIIAAALEAGCVILYSEDLQDGQVIDGLLTIRNPFA